MDRRSYEEIAKYFDKPFHEACCLLKLTQEELRANCRSYNIKRWPYKSNVVGEKQNSEQTLFNCFAVQLNKQLQNAPNNSTNSAPSVPQAQHVVLPSFSTLIRQIEFQ